jgi:hypothetical protein
MAIVRRALQKRNVRANQDGAVGPETLADSLRKHRYCFDNFMQEPLCWKQGGFVIPTGSTLVKNLVWTGTHTFEYTPILDQTDLLYPTLATDGGYNIVLASSDLGMGVEFNFGGDIATHPRTFKTSHEDWFARVLFSADDASGADILFGAKKVAATVASITEMIDVFGVRILGTSDSSNGTYTIVSNQNNEGTTDYTSTATSVTPLEDATDVEVEIRGVNGKMYLFVDGAAVPNLTWTADSGDVFSPILRVSQATDTCPAVRLYAFECGLLKDRTDGKLIDLTQATA